MFRYRCEEVGSGLILEGDVPQFIGNGRIIVGDDLRVGTRNTWVVGFKASEKAELVIGNRVSVNYQTSISVATQVHIGDDTMIAGNVQIYDNISHPLSPSRRLRHEPFTLDEASPIIIGRNVWIGNGAMIMRGVTIGDNSVVAAGSIVTKPVPADTLVAGSPARVVKSITDGERDAE
jgi:acetyltransferase-like isoleucine patch superfamily enzyme